MTSKILSSVTVDPETPDEEVMRRAGDIIRSGGLVAFPTETVYGLAADATDEVAVARIFETKGRPPDNPLIVHVAGREDLGRVVDVVPKAAEGLIDRFWPGALTLVLPADPGLARTVTAGLDTVAVRSPAHPVARALIRFSGVPLAAPSANRSGRPSPTRAEHVFEDFQEEGDKIGLLLDGGPCTIGVESTVIDLSTDVPTVLRLGGVEVKQLQQVLENVRIDPHAKGVAVAPGTMAASPGMKHRHYAPQVPLYVFEGPGAGEPLTAAYGKSRQTAKKTGLIVSTETARDQGLEGDYVVVIGPRSDAEAWAHELFHALRDLDLRGVDEIFVEGIPEQGLGAAVMDRLRRAAQK